MKHYYDVCLGPKGLPIPNVSVTVWIAGTGQTQLATIYSDDGITTKANPTTSDALGNVDFYVADGRYDLQFSGPGITSRLETDIEISDITQAATSDSSAVFKNLNNIRFADQFAGADAGAKIAAAIADLASTGGVVDARALEGAQSFTSNPFSGITKKITLITGRSTYTWDPASVAVDVPSHFRLVAEGTTFQASVANIGGSMYAPNQLNGGLFSARVFSTTGSITTGTASLTVASATGAEVGNLVAILGATGAATGAGGEQSTTINQVGGIAAGDTSVTVTSTSGFAASNLPFSNYIMIDSEIMSYSGSTGTSFTGLTRGLFGTTAASHTNTTKVYAVPFMVSEITAISGTTFTLVSNASQTVTSSTVLIGSTDISFEGTPIFDGNYTDRTVAVSGTTHLAGVLATLATNVTVSSMAKFQNFGHQGVIGFAARRCHFSGHFRHIGRPANPSGADVWLFGGSQYNHVITSSQDDGCYPLLIDDRSGNYTAFALPSSFNSVLLGPIFGRYTFGPGVEGGSSYNTIRMGYIATATYGPNVVSGQWTTNPTPKGNTFYFGTVDYGSGNSILGNGYTGGGNLFIGNTMVPSPGGNLSMVSGDSLIYVGSATTGYLTSTPGWTGPANQWGMTRSGGASGFPDIYGDGTNDLVLGGKSDGTGNIRLDSATKLTKTISVYNNVSTVGNGIPSLVAKADLTAQSANVGSTVLYSVPANGAGFYRATAYLVVTQAATTSSTLPNAQLSFTDNETGVGTGTGNFTGAPTSNIVGTANSSTSAPVAGVVVINAKASTNILYQTANYASVGATSMQFAIHVKLEYLGS